MVDSGANVRAGAAWVVCQVLSQGQSLSAAMHSARLEFSDTRDRALLEAICYAVLRQRRSLEFGLAQLMKKSLQRQDPISHALLLVGLAQLHSLNLSAHAAVAASVEAARLLGRAGRVGLINAVLRTSVREGLPVAEDMAIVHNHPDWLLQQLQRDWPEEALRIVQANNQVAPLCLRVNQGRQTRAAYLAVLQAAGIAAQPSALAEHAIFIEQAMAPPRLPEWEAGAIAVQDQSAQLAVLGLAPQPGETVLDMCAAPGGKSAQLAEYALKQLVLLDQDAARLDKVTELFKRLQLTQTPVLMQVHDASMPLPSALPAQYDAILLDAPCSATGIIRRQPDIKWHRQAKDIDALNTVQWRLLKNAWHCLKPGGRLLYSTCSVLKAENETMLMHFLKQHPDAHARALDDRFGRVSGAGRQRFPGEDGGDGFFYALLERV